MIWVNGERVDQMTERELMEVRADLGMVFQEGALFDSLTVRENVGYKLYEETDMPLDAGATRASRKCSASSASASTSTGCRRSCRAASGAASRSRGRWRSSRAILLYDEATTGLDPITATTVDEEIIKLRDLEGVSSIVVTHQLRDAFYVADAHGGARADGADRDRAGRRRRSSDEAEFIMLKDGLIVFEGDAAGDCGARPIRI